MSLVRENLSPLERAQLASAVYDCAFEAFESFQDENVGADVAYLMGVILSIPEQHLTADWSEDRPALLDALKTKFPADSPLWNYIVTAPPKLTTPEEMNAAVASLKEKLAGAGSNVEINESRVLVKVIDQILAVVPDDQEWASLRGGLAAVQSSSSFAAPEMQSTFWNEASYLLQDGLGDPASAEWKMQVAQIFSGRSE